MQNTMNFEEFRKSIIEKYSFINERHRKEILNIAEHVLNKNYNAINNILNSNDSNQILKLTKKIERDIKKIWDYQEYKKKEVISESDTLYADILLKEIEPSIEEIRLKLFNTIEAPFSNLEDSSNWICEMSNIIDNQEAHERKLWIAKHLHKGIKYEEVLLPFRNKDNKIDFAASEYNNNLKYLKYYVEKLSKYTRFNECDIVTYILTGKKPEFHRFKTTKYTEWIVLPNGKKRVNTWFTVDLNAGDIKFDEIKKIYDFYREKLNVKAQKPLKENSHVLIDFINNEIGELPPGYSLKSMGKKVPKGTGDKMYWEKVLLLWNEKYPENQYKRWDYIEKAYYRIIHVINKKKGV